MDFSNTLFRCSSLGHIMTNPRKGSSSPLSETCITHLVDVYVANKYGRQDDIQSKYIEKGLAVEEDSITLLSRVKGKFYKKNEDRLSNEFIKGTPDLYEGEDITAATEIIDVKSSWDIYTFHRVLTKEVNSMYWWQGQGYMALTGAQKFRLAYCLVNTPEPMIADEKRRLLWKMGVVSEADPLYIEAAEKLDAAMRFDEIPIRERLIEFEIERDQEAIDSMYSRIVECRKWLNEFEGKRISLTKVDVLA